MFLLKKLLMNHQNKLPYLLIATLTIMIVSMIYGLWKNHVNYQHAIDSSNISNSIDIIDEEISDNEQQIEQVDENINDIRKNISKLKSKKIKQDSNIELDELDNFFDERGF